jgi:hypothetical protein
VQGVLRDSGPKSDNSHGKRDVLVHVDVLQVPLGFLRRSGAASMTPPRRIRLSADGPALPIVGETEDAYIVMSYWTGRTFSFRKDAVEVVE